MKRIIMMLFAALLLLPAWAQGGSGAGYDPVNPPEPQAGYRLTAEASPAKGGTVSPQRLWSQEGETIYVEAYAKPGYEFRAWMLGDEVVSDSQFFHYTMPAEAVHLIAWFDKVDYNPGNPGEPFDDGYYHKVSLYSSPSTGGWFSNNSFVIREGETEQVWAYANSDYTFQCWKQDGKIVSTDQWLDITMGDRNLEYTAQFSYSPASPAEPGVNSWNEATGELIIDNFTPGNLWGTVEQMTQGNLDAVGKLTVTGPMWTGEYSVCQRLPNLVEADFSRTSGGYSVVPWAFDNCLALTKVVLPASVTGIEYYSFNGCENLSELVVYAAMPPVIHPRALAGVPSNLVVKVYSSSLDLYQRAEVWEDYKILTLDEESTALSVTLPDDAADGRYRNASLQLNNHQSGQSRKLVITGNRTKYIFNNLVPDMKYGLYVLAPDGTVIGKYLDFVIPGEGMDYKFDKLLQMQSVRLEVLTPEGEDVADRVSVSWYDEGRKFIGSGAEITGQVEGRKLGYGISLPRDLGVEYLMPDNGEWTVDVKENLIKTELKRFGKKEISGTLTDGLLNEPLAGGYVTVTQNLNGQYPQSSTATSGKDGKWTLTVVDAPGILTAGSPDHMEESISFETAAQAQKYAQMAVKPVFGTELNLTLLCRGNILPDEKENGYTEYEDHDNVIYKVENLTNKKEIRNLRLRWPRLMLLDGVKEGDLIRVTAAPRNSAFNPGTDECNIVGGKGDVKIAFSGNGDLTAGYVSCASPEVVALLYDGNGTLLRKTAYEGRNAAFKGLPTGKYTLVTMVSSHLFSAAGSLNDLSPSLLKAGKDYLSTEAVVKDGYITAVHHDEVPVFDESMFYYTTPETSVTVNKSNVTVGAIVTVRSKVEFLPEYRDKIDKVKIIFTLPEGCDYIDNSLLVAGAGASFITTEEGRLSVDVNAKDASPRFCVIPRLGGEYRPSAAIEFELGGETIVQPIGSALFTAGDFMISVPEATAGTTITARGAATALSEVKVYDNDVFVGTARTLTNGDWHLTFGLFEPGEYSEHRIRAEITTPEGVKYQTSTQLCVYEKGWSELLHIDMVYGGATVDFDHIEGTTLPGSYSYVPGQENFMFKAAFAGESAADIERLEFVIKLSDGSTRTIEGKLLKSQGVWACALGFPDVNRLPVNVRVVFSNPNCKYVPKDADIYRCPDCVPIIDPSGYVYEAVPSNRVEGVMATIFYKELKENMYGEVYEEVVKWDAEAYAQSNPLFTDAQGMYQWDVPQGEWQVKFEKEGYETTRTDWLPVPPPQLDVNVGIVQTAAPQVASGRADTRTVEVLFDKFMQPSSLVADNLAVTAGGTAVEGQWTLVDAEEAPDGAEYARGARFEPAEPIAAEEVTLTVSPRVRSYAGISMGEEYRQEFTVEPEIESLEAEAPATAYTEEPVMMQVTVLPAKASAGKTLLVEADSPVVTFDRNVVIDEDGKAIVNVTADLPGEVTFTFRVEDSDVAATVCTVAFETYVEPVVEKIEVSESFEAIVDEPLLVEVKVLPADASAGKALLVSADSDIAEFTAAPVIDEEGDVIVEVTGRSVGEVTLTFSVEGYEATATTKITIAEKNETGVATTAAESLQVLTGDDGGCITVTGGDAHVVITSPAGRIVFAGMVADGATVAPDALMPGVYVLTATDGKEKMTRKFVRK